MNFEITRTLSDAQTILNLCCITVSSFTDQVQVYMARLTSMEVEKKYDALTEERASEVLELCDFVLDKIKVGWEVITFMISKYSKNQIL